MLNAARNTVPAAAWFAADATRGNCPPELAGHEISELHVRYKRNPLPKQRRYTDGPCIFWLPRQARRERVASGRRETSSRLGSVPFCTSPEGGGYF